MQINSQVQIPTIPLETYSLGFVLGAIAYILYPVLTYLMEDINISHLNDVESSGDSLSNLAVEYNQEDINISYLNDVESSGDSLSNLAVKYKQEDIDIALSDPFDLRQENREEFLQKLVRRTIKKIESGKLEVWSSDKFIPRNSVDQSQLANMMISRSSFENLALQNKVGIEYISESVQQEIAEISISEYGYYVEEFPYWFVAPMDKNNLFIRVVHKILNPVSQEEIDNCIPSNNTNDHYQDWKKYSLSLQIVLVKKFPEYTKKQIANEICEVLLKRGVKNRSGNPISLTSVLRDGMNVLKSKKK